MAEVSFFHETKSTCYTFTLIIHSMYTKLSLKNKDKHSPTDLLDIENVYGSLRDFAPGSGPWVPRTVIKTFSLESEVWKYKISMCSQRTSVLANQMQNQHLTFSLLSSPPRLVLMPCVLQGLCEGSTMIFTTDRVAIRCKNLSLVQISWYSFEGVSVNCWTLLRLNIWLEILWEEAFASCCSLN